MQLPSCAQCGAPLPAVPADPAHPERCGACAARALQGAGAGLPVSPPVMARPAATVPTAAGAFPLGVDRPTVVVRTRPADALLVGTASAAVAGVVWWAISGGGDVEAWHFAAALVGLIVGQGVLLGARRGGAVPGVIAAVLSTLVILVTVYFIDRSRQLADLAENGIASDIPLWQGLGAFWDSIKGWVDYDAGKAAGWLLAPAIAAVLAARPNARPGLRLR